MGVKSQFILSLVLATLFVTEAVSQITTEWPRGFPEVTTFTNQGDYIGAGQTYQAAEDDRGVIYFGNLVHGVQIYDGNNWQRLSFLTSQQIIAMNWHEKRKRMYAGADSFFGYITVNERNVYEFVDLTAEHSMQEFTWPRIDELLRWNDDILIRMETQLLIWDGQDSRNIFNHGGYIYSVNPTQMGIWMYVRGHGLVRGDEHGFEMVAYPSQYGAVAGVFDEGNSVLAFTRQGYLLDFHTETEEWILRNPNGIQANRNQEFNRIIETRDGSFAATTGADGVFFINRDGSLRYHMTNEHGLSANTKSYLFEDSNGSVWAGSPVGISMIEYASPFRVLRGEQQAPGRSNEMVSHNGNLYIATTGIYRWDGAEQSWQTLIEGTGRIVNIRSDNGNRLFALSAAGMYQVVGDQVSRVYPYSMYDVEFSRVHPNRMYGVNGPWLKIFRLDDDGRFITREAQFNLDARLVTVHEDADGGLWFGTGRTFMYVTLDGEGSDIQIASKEVYTSEHGVPDGNYNYSFRKGNEILYITFIGNHYFDPEQQRFFPLDRHKNAYMDSDRRSWPVDEDAFDRLWIDLNGIRLGFLDLTSEPPYTWVSQPFRRHGPYQNIHRFLSPTPDDVYVITPFMLSRFDLTRLHEIPAPGHALISSVHYAVDSLISGAGAPRNFTYSESLPFTRFPIRFAWGSTSHLPKRYRWFQTKLVGFDDDWSERTQELRREFTNLSAGRYEFRVRTFDIYNQLGEEASFAFRIAPPWYASIWAFLFYGLLAIFGVMGIVRLRTATLEKRQAELEETVKVRTKEIESQKVKAEEDREIISQQSEKLRESERMRTRLFADITHEFRTPITISQGLMDKVDKDLAAGKADKQDIDVIKRNIRRLGQMINQIIDITKYDNQILTVQSETLHAEPLVRRIAESFRSLADSKKQFFEVRITSKDTIVDADPDKLETILNNLIHNAIKFTPVEGSVIVTIESDEANFRVTVEDSGPGIAAEYAESIFNRFHRIRNENLPYQEGMGIGLELSRKLARKMNAEIHLDSKKTKGSRFVFEIPVSSASPDLIEAPVIKEVIQAEATIESLPGATPDSGGESWKILLVEDNRDMRAYVERIIQELGEIKVAIDGLQALEIMKTWQPDIVISDLMMPKLDGIELTKRMAGDKLLRTIPVIILTAKTFVDDKLELLRLGVVDYVTKPFVPEELLLRIQNSLEKFTARKQIQIQMAGKTKEVDQAVSDVSKAAQYIYEHITEMELTAETVADALNMSRSSLYRYIKMETGLTPAKFVREVKLRFARELILANPGLSLDEIAFQSGFQKASWFSKLFEEQYGVKPQQLNRG